MTDRTSLGDRMKGQYENRTRAYLPRRTYTIIRLDGMFASMKPSGGAPPPDAPPPEKSEKK